jgi:hypothetical protein
MVNFGSIKPAGGILCALALLFSFAQPARAELVGTDEILQSANQEREAIVQAMERDEVAAELEAMGISVQDARTRVNRMTDAEVAQLHERVGALPAGGDFSGLEVLLIVILVILVF